MRQLTFQENMPEHIGAVNAEAALETYIKRLRLPVNKQDYLVHLIVAYANERCQGAYAQGAIERPMVKEHIDGELVAVYNETPK